MKFLVIARPGEDRVVDLTDYGSLIHLAGI